MSKWSYPLVPYEKFYSLNNFLSEDYLKERGVEHRGVDLNLKTGGNSDLGYPVLNMLPGTVIFAEILETNWQGLVMVRTEDSIRQTIEDTLQRDLPVLDILYAHLLHVTVQPGQFINSGVSIGSIGDGWGSFKAHLHLETRINDFIAYKPQDNDKQFVLDNCFDPHLLFDTGLFEDETKQFPFGRFEATGDVYFNDLPAGKNAVINRVSGKKLYIKV